MHSTDDLDDGYLGSGRRLLRSIKKHGIDNHTRVIVESVSSREELRVREQQIVNDELLAEPLCLNMTIGGEGGPTRQGMCHHESTKKLISEALLGHSVSQSTRDKIGFKSKGRCKGRHLSEEHKAKLSKSRLGKASPMKGLRRPPEVGKKISIALRAHNALIPRHKKERCRSDPHEVKKKLSDAAKRQWSDPIMRQRNLDARKHPPDTRELTLYCDDQRHLVCTPFSIENLHRAASMLNIKKCWFHRGIHPHYDIPQRRIIEITAKCKVVSSRDIIEIIKGETP